MADKEEQRAEAQQQGEGYGSFLLISQSPLAGAYERQLGELISLAVLRESRLVPRSHAFLALLAAVRNDLDPAGGTGKRVVPWMTESGHAPVTVRVVLMQAGGELAGDVSQQGGRRRTTKAMCFMRPSSGRFLNCTPSPSSRLHSASTSSTEIAMWPKPASPGQLGRFGPGWRVLTAAGLLVAVSVLEVGVVLRAVLQRDWNQL